MKKFFTLIIALTYTTISFGQITTAPALPTASDEVVITFNATVYNQGDRNLAGYTGDVYAHTGVTIEGTGRWQSVIGSWGNNTTQPKLMRVAPDTYTLTLSPSIMGFYSVATYKTVTELCFVFRASDGSRQTEDIFVTVVKEGLTVKINSPDRDKPFYSFATNLNISVQANNSTSLSLLVNNAEVSTSTTNSISYTYPIDSYGLQWIKAIASDGTNEVKDSVYFFVRGNTPVAELPEGLVPGANITGDNSVTLVLHDPAAKKEFAFAIGDFSNWQLDEEFFMNRTTDGTHYWITITDLEPTKEYIYQYWIDGTVKMADPYTHKTSDPWNDKWISESTYPNLIPYPDGKTKGIASVFQIEQEEYQWQTENFVAPPKGELIIYELHIRDFVDDDYIMSVLEKLDYLETLGVNAIELMPINEFEGNDSWGYNPSFYFATDKAYGTKNNYKKFIDECHKRGMAVIIDMVQNHSYGQSPFVQMYFDASAGDWGQPTADNPWYNQTCPHEPWCWGYDFDHKSSFTVELMNKVNEFWLTEFRVDGFRFDFTKGFTNVQTGGQGWDYDAQRIAILKNYADHIWSVNPNAYVILEHFTANPEEKELAEYRANEGMGMMVWGNMTGAYGDASMGWIPNSNFSRVSHKQRGWTVPHLIGYMESHDEERMMYKNLNNGNSTNPAYNVKSFEVAIERLKLAGTFFFTIPGPKMIWQFGELAYDFPINYNDRVGRKPVRWDYYDDANRRSLYNHWAELLALRKAFPVFNTNDFTLSVAEAGKRITLRHPDMNVVIVGNFDVTQKGLTFTFPNTGQWFEYYSQSDINIQSTSQTFTLQPGEFRIYTSMYIDRKDYAVSSPAMEIDQNPLRVDIWPNPAASNLNIAINNSNSEMVDIKVYDINGRFISTIHQGKLMPGENSISWVKPNGIGKGVYFVVIQTDSTRKTRRIILQ